MLRFEILDLGVEKRCDQGKINRIIEVESMGGKHTFSKCFIIFKKEPDLPKRHL